MNATGTQAGLIFRPGLDAASVQRLISLANVSRRAAKVGFAGFGGAVGSGIHPQGIVAVTVACVVLCVASFATVWIVNRRLSRDTNVVKVSGHPDLFPVMSAVAASGNAELHEALWRVANLRRSGADIVEWYRN